MSEQLWDKRIRSETQISDNLDEKKLKNNEKYIKRYDRYRHLLNNK